MMGAFTCRLWFRCSALGRRRITRTDPSSSNSVSRSSHEIQGISVISVLATTRPSSSVKLERCSRIAVTLAGMGVHPAADAILQTALQLVDREGCDALTIRALVRESGISNGSVYHHVGSLESLRALVADEAVKDWAAQFLHALDARGYAGAAEHDMHWSRAHSAL